VATVAEVAELDGPAEPDEAGRSVTERQFIVAEGGAFDSTARTARRLSRGHGPRASSSQKAPYNGPIRDEVAGADEFVLKSAVQRPDPG